MKAKSTKDDMERSAESILERRPWVREYLEIAYDTARDKPKVTGFVCKVCWKNFDASVNAISLLGHVAYHRSKQQQPYQSRRRLFLSGKDILERRDALVKYFKVVAPEVGAWKFRCRTCDKRFPGRTDYDELFRHGVACSEAR